MSDVAEYLPTAPRQKAFDIVPAAPDLTTLILGARDEVVNDPEISHGAARMFVKILDLSVRQASNVRPGVVTISQTKLAETFGVSTRSIWNWKWELLKKKVIWMTSQPMPNAWPIDTYHVTAVHAQQYAHEKTSVEGLWGNGVRQRRPDHNGLGAREPGQVTIPGTGVRSKNLRVETSFQNPKKSSILPAIATPARNELPPAAETDFGGEPKQIASHRRKEFRRGAEASCEPPPKNSSADARKNLRRGAEASCEHIKAKVAGFSIPKGGGTPPAASQDVEIAFKGWERRLDDMRNSDLRDLERITLAEYQKAPEGPAKDNAHRKLQAIRVRLRGPVVAAMNGTKPKPARKAPQDEKPLTEEQLLDSAREAVALGSKFLTEGQKAALRRAGELK